MEIVLKNVEVAGEVDYWKITMGIIGGNDLLRVPGRTNVRVFIGCLFVDAELPEVILEPKMPFACDDYLACIKTCQMLRARVP